MSGKLLFLGIDTSNYTTSTALCDDCGNILLNVKLPLPVSPGERGLRQSDAVFHHVKNLPQAANEYRRVLWETDGTLSAVGVSYAPRDLDGSYMPCFLSGIAAAEYASATAGVPLYKTSHQAGHIMAALSSACAVSGTDMKEISASPFLAFHVSGGTTDLLYCEPASGELVFRITRIGGTLDLNAGQLVDRTGVMMGMQFPCGAEMDELACSVARAPRGFSRTSVQGMSCNLSGLENKAAEMYKNTGNRAEVSAFTLNFIAKTLEQMTLCAIDKYGRIPVIYSGGVMSSRYIKKTLEKYGMFAEACYSSDNAAGCALLAAELYRRTH